MDVVLQSRVFLDIVPLGRDLKKFSGRLNLSIENNCSVFLELFCPNFPYSSSVSLKFGSIIGTEFSVSQLELIRDEVIEKNLSSNSLGSILISDLLSDFVEAYSAKSINKSNLVITDNVFYETILEDLRIIGWDKVSEMNLFTKKVTFNIFDSVLLSVFLPKEYPEKLVSEWTGEIPSNFSVKPGYLRDVYKDFSNLVSDYSPVWSLLEEIDSECRVIDPIRPTKGDLYRRILVCSGVSLHIALTPDLVPDLKFLGPDSKTCQFRPLLRNYIKDYDEEESLLKNLENILNITFPGPSEKTEDYEIECGICYSFLLDEKPPNKSCEEQRCSKSYHDACLIEYLRSSIDAKRSLNILFGTCPYCESQISCQIQSL